MRVRVREHKMVLLGEGGVGKSTLTLRLITNRFVDEYDATIEDSYRKQVTVDHQPCILDILDTAGQEEYNDMREEYIQRAEGFLCLYDTTSRTSWAQVSHIHQKVIQRRGDAIPLILVGTKCDLVDARQVSVQEGHDLGRSLGCPFFETSAQDRTNLEEVFYQLVREIRKYYQYPPIEERTGRKGCLLM